MADSTDNKEVCYLTSKLSAETRVATYEYVFGPGKYAKYVTAAGEASADGARSTACVDDPEPLELDTSVFVVNSLFNSEAMETFFNNKVVRVTFDQLRDLLAKSEIRGLVRDVEIIECNTVEYQAEHIREVLDDVQTLPRLRSFTILSDYLAVTGTAEEHMTVRQYVDKYRLGKVICTDIGRYRLEGSKVAFAHRKILKMWPNVTSTPDEYKVFDELVQLHLENTISGTVSSIMAWMAHQSLRLWVALYEKLKTRIVTGEMSEEEEQAAELGPISVLSWSQTLIQRREDIPLLLNGKDGNVHMRQLGPRHDAVTLENATELLSMNIATYICNADDWPNGKPFKPKWPELGEESELLRQVEIQNRRREAIQQYLCIPDPCNHNIHYNKEQVRANLLANDTFRSLFGEQEIQDANKNTLMRMLYFRESLAGPHLTENEEVSLEDKQAEADEWSANLLMQYVSRCGIELEDASANVGYWRLLVAKGLVLLKAANKSGLRENLAETEGEGLKDEGQQHEGQGNSFQQETESEDDGGLVYPPLVEKLKTSLIAASIMDSQRSQDK